jgi:hypothetical protein
MAYKSAPLVTRPANATPYTAGDVVGGAIEFKDIGPASGDILITSAALRIHVAAIPSGMTSFRLHLYDITPPSATADNAAWDLPAGDRANYMGYVDLGSPADVGSTLHVQTDQINKPVRLAGSYSLWAYLVSNGGFTPAGNSEVYVPTLYAISLPNER